MVTLMVKGRGGKTENEIVRNLGISECQIRRALVRAKRKLNVQLIIKKLRREGRLVDAALIELKHHFPVLEWGLNKWC